MRNDRDDSIEWQPTGRATRWYEWLFILLLLGFAAGVRAESVYKCIGAAGEVAYQGQPCAPEQHATLIRIAPAPAFAPSPQYALPDRAAQARVATRAPTRHEAQQPASFLCRTADGQVFYRHGACPHSVASAGSNSGHEGARSSRGKRSSTMASTTSVASERISRDEACHEIQRAGAIGRSGHEHDETVSTYERNLGRDPCR